MMIDRPAVKSIGAFFERTVISKNKHSCRKFQLDISIVSIVHNDIGFEVSAIAIVRRRYEITKHGFRENVKSGTALAMAYITVR